jgi:hypothetical protein
MTLDRFDDRPFLILCEGEGDKRFIDNLIAFRGIANEFQVRFPDRGNTGTGGRSKFGPWLSDRMDLSEDFRQNIKAVLIVSDNDLVPAISFKEVQDSLRKSNGFPIPDAERTVRQVRNFPPIVILMIPDGVPGNLETLCVQAALQKWPHVQTPLATFVGAIGVSAWEVGKQDKMRLQTILASTGEERPEAGFVGHWRCNDKYHLPLGHNSFDTIETFLRGFRVMVGL